ncbi:hypothetical protein ACFYV7_35925 [Nocardia suismassiliense]|uniref:Cytochrome P450 n=1 Tax=Nocardia suismassiliense TaxID=2077092 RepID=A0ABW6R671_9NOCA
MAALLPGTVVDLRERFAYPVPIRVISEMIGVPDELIATYDEDGSRLTEKGLVDTLMLIITAGHETTVNLLDHAIFALLTQPRQRADVLAGRSSPLPRCTAGQVGGAGRAACLVCPFSGAAAGRRACRGGAVGQLHLEWACATARLSRRLSRVVRISEGLDSRPAHSRSHR